MYCTVCVFTSCILLWCFDVWFPLADEAFSIMLNFTYFVSLQSKDAKASGGHSPSKKPVGLASLKHQQQIEYHSDKSLERRVPDPEERVMAVPQPNEPVPVSSGSAPADIDSNRLKGNSIQPDGPHVYSPPQGPRQPIIRKKQRSDFRFGKLLGEGSYSEVRPYNFPTYCISQCKVIGPCLCPL